MPRPHVNNPLRLGAAERCESFRDGVDCRIGEVERKLRGQAGTNFAGRILPQHKYYCDKFIISARSVGNDPYSK